MLQDLQVIASRDLRRVFSSQAVISHSKAAVREEILTVPIVFECTGFPHQRIDDVAIVDRLFVPSHKTRQRVNQQATIPDFHTIRVQPCFDLQTNQTAMDRIRIAVDVNQAAGINSDHQTLTRLQSL